LCIRTAQSRSSRRADSCLGRPADWIELAGIATVLAQAENCEARWGAIGQHNVVFSGGRGAVKVSDLRVMGENDGMSSANPNGGKRQRRFEV